MITFVYVSHNKDDAFECDIKTSCGFDDCEFLHFSEKNFSQAYNKALKKAKHNIIVFLRDDIEIHSKNWGVKVVNYFECYDYSILGIVGSITIPLSGLVWENEESLVGRIWYESYDSKNENAFSGIFSGKIIQVAAVDDSLFIVNRDRIKKNFDTNYNGDSFYEIDFCLENIKNGGKIGVIFDLKIVKLTFNEKDNCWINNRKHFINNNKELPIHITPTIILDKGKIKIENQPKVTLIIANKNKPVELASSLESIYEKSNYNNLEIIIIDLGSDANNLQDIKDFIFKHENTRLFEINNEHIPEIYNEIVKDNITNDTELLLFCDPEIILLNDAISRMVNVYLSDKDKCGTIGIRMHNKNNMVRHFGLHLFSTHVEDDFELGIGFHGFKSAYKYQNKIIKDIAGSSRDFMMISKKLYEEVGGFNKQYNYSLDDFELNLKTILHKRRNYLSGNSVAYYLGDDIPKFLPFDFEILINFINEHIDIIKNYFC